jgi:uncharacterized protein YeaO (DUF488 family)
MAIRMVRLGSPRAEGEGIRIGAVRRAARGGSQGSPATDAAAGGDYDVWFPTLAPSQETLRLAQEAKTAVQRAAFARKYRIEMSRPESSQSIQLLAFLSHETNLAVGCYCPDEFHCHLPVLRELLEEKGARFADAAADPMQPASPAARVSPPESVLRSGVVLPFPARADAAAAEGPAGPDSMAFQG